MPYLQEEIAFQLFCIYKLDVSRQHTTKLAHVVALGIISSWSWTGYHINNKCHSVFK